MRRAGEEACATVGKGWGQGFVRTEAKRTRLFVSFAKKKCRARKRNEHSTVTRIRVHEMRGVPDRRAGDEKMAGRGRRGEGVEWEKWARWEARKKGRKA